MLNSGHGVDHFAELRALLAAHGHSGTPATQPGKGSDLQAALQEQVLMQHAASAAILHASQQQAAAPSEACATRRHQRAGQAAPTYTLPSADLVLQQALALQSQAMHRAEILAQQAYAAGAAQAEAQAAAAAAAQQQQPIAVNARLGRRRSSAKRSLSAVFDVVAATEAAAAQAGRGDMDIATPPLAPLGPASPVAPITPAGTPGTSPAANEHMLPLQHLLLSDRAQRLSSLDTKAIIYRVASDLASIHGSGGIHRHVAISSIGLERSGNLSTARLLAHPANVSVGVRRSFTSPKLSGVDAYLSPELARCPAHLTTYTPAGDMWGLGVVLFVLLSGSHVPFGNRGLCWTSVPNMPGPGESVDQLQRWLEEHLLCKVEVINQLSAAQQAQRGGAGFEVRVVGFDSDASGLLSALLRADPGQRPTAEQVLRHPWLAEVVGLMPAPQGSMRTASAELAQMSSPFATAPLPGTYEEMLHRTATLGFSPQTPSGTLGALASPYGSGLHSLGLDAGSLAHSALQGLLRGSSMHDSAFLQAGGPSMMDQGASGSGSLPWASWGVPAQQAFPGHATQQAQLAQWHQTTQAMQQQQQQQQQLEVQRWQV